MYTAKLIGESDNHIETRQFAEEGAAIRWITGAGLADFSDQTARGEVWRDGQVRWTRGNLQTKENEERDRLAYAARWRAGAFN
ncbi:MULTISPECIES: hypothetical protein [Bradyrhizobium]|uniref:hypothetical protein n=1 Tax=Bradyrhizobium TaxID=374 RepID=UPI00041DED0B|nr:MULTISPECIES: hypothetical protein [Bradyrhizobium]UFW50493.1 hypothetical protein BaraCB756_05365 [Bradyrhizobium arachidis]